MSQSLSRKRPWLAAFLGAAATGLGHLYLRRWLRGVGWATLALLASYLVVPESALEALISGGQVAWLDILPLIVVSVASALDAYRLAVVNNYLLRMRSSGEEARTACPSCGRPVDDDLDFCQWCAASLPEKSSEEQSDRPREP
jgi:hypothetical protein